MWCRARPDMLSADKRVCLDYKSSASAAPDFIAKQIGRMGYDLQSAFYTRGISTVTGAEPTFVFLFQEIEPPYACSLISLANAYRAVGESKAKRALWLWERAMKTNNWPGYSSKILYAEPRPWDLAQAEEMEAT